MDTSEEYIKMCEKVVIEEGYYGLGDYISSNGSVGIIVGVEGLFPPTDAYLILKPIVSGESYKVLASQATKLYKQDQLQEMIRRGDTLDELNKRFSDYLDDGYPNHLEQQPMGSFNSYEKLWLAFIMKENFNKTWDGEQWI